MEVSDIQHMSKTERLQAMELLWDTLARDAESVPSPAWHQQVLEKRMEKIRKGEGQFLTAKELKSRLIDS